MHTRRRFLKSGVAGVLTLAVAQRATAQEYTLSYLVVSSFSELTLAFARAIEQRTNEPLTQLTWQTSFSNENFKIEAAGEAASGGFSLELSGYLWRAENGNATIVYIGTGEVSGEPMSMSGRAEWIFESEIQSHNLLDIELVTKFGENSTWTWFKGAEVVVGGLIGGAGAVGATTLSTLGAGVVASPWAALAGFLGGSAAAISLSNEFNGEADSEAPAPEPQELPEPPQPPEPNTAIAIGEGLMIVAVGADNRIFGATSEGRYLLQGSYSIDDGFAEGRVDLSA